MFFVKRFNFNKTNIIKGLITAILFSAFIPLAFFDIQLKIIYSLFALSSIYLILTINKTSLIISGFFIGIFWFYWIAISFIYYDLSLLIPFVIIAIGFAYALFFYLLSFVNLPTFRAFGLFALSYFEPFGFNWFKVELLFVNSYFNIDKISFALILFSVFLLSRKRWHKLLFIIPLLFAINFKSTKKIEDPNIKIHMAQLNINQDEKWEEKNRLKVINKNITEINYAIDNAYDLVVLPETTLPLILNNDEFMLDFLKKKSLKIDIILGSLYKEDTNYYNATYFFTKGEFKVAKKLVLVPFGEEIPFPKFIRDFINDTFYGGAKDYSKAKNATDFTIKGYKFRNAICYEATTDEIFKDLKDVKYMIAISNNAWFMPSFQATLQKQLMKYYAKKYDIQIYHIVNKSKNFIIKP